MEELSQGALFAGHRIEGVAGRGGMGVVYRARDLRLERLVALKLIAPELAQRPELRSRFVTESRIAATLDHPSIVPVFYAGEESGTAFIAMRFVEGPDLRTLVRERGPLDPRQAVDIVCDVADALDAAHARGLVHRDVKPGNVLVGPENRVFLTDFGLTKRIDASGGDTRPGDWVGTVDYVAPEMIRGLPFDRRADVYALGAVLFYVLTGRPPFLRGRDEGVMWAHVHEPPPRPSAVRPDLPPGFDDVVERAMSKDPESRYATAGDLARAARGALSRTDDPTVSRTHTGGTAVMPRPVTASQRPWVARRVAPFAALLALVAAAAVIVVGLTAEEPRPVSGGGRPPPLARVVAKVPVGERPGELALTRHRLWVVSAHTTTVSSIDRSTSSLASNAGGLEQGISSAAAGFGTLWVTNRRTDVLTALHARTHRPQHRIPMPDHPEVVRIGFGAVWVVTAGDPAVLLEVDPETYQVERRVTLPGRDATYLALGEGALWVTNTLANRLWRIDPRTLEITGSRSAGADPRSVAVGHGAVWVAVPSLDAVLRYSPNLRTKDVIAVGRRPYGVSATAGGVWASNLVGGTVVRLEPDGSGLRGKPVAVGRHPYVLAVGPHELWVSLVDDNAVARLHVP